MLKLEIDLSRIKNEINQLHNELHDTYTMNDTQRRDAVNRAIEKVRTLKTMIENGTVETTIK